MRYGMVWVALVSFGVATGWAQGGKDARPETLIRWRFAGTEQLRQLQDQKPLQAVLDMPETAALREAAFNAFARGAAARFAGPDAGHQKENSDRIKALFPDLLRQETRFVMVAGEEGEANWALAIKLPPEREGEWRKQLTELAQSAGMQVSDTGKWHASREKYHLNLAREGKWTLLEGGYTQAKDSKPISEFRKNLDKNTEKQVLSAEVNFPELGSLWKAPRLAHAPRLNLRSAPNRDGFRSEVQLDYPRDLGIKPEKWAVPGGLFREPLVGFTAIQGVRQAIESSPAAQNLGLEKKPNQIFAWSVGDTPFSVYAAGDVGNPKQVIANLVERVIPGFRQSQGPMFATAPQVSSNGLAVAWRGAIPVAVPFARVAPAPASNYLVLGLFPVGSDNTNKVPTELFEQLKKKNLIYYEWEITEGRLKQWRPIWQLVQMASMKTPNSASVSEKWLAEVTPQLGNTVTEATLENDHRIHVTRQSHLGFNALELVMLAHWLDPQDVREDGGAPGLPGGQTHPRPPASPNAETGR